jgi:two-component system sensor histidine kinase KdpD
VRLFLPSDPECMVVGWLRERPAEEPLDESAPVSRFWRPSRAAAHEYAIATIGIALVTAVSLALEPLTGHAAVALLYLLLVVIAGLKLGRGPVLFIAASGAVLWDLLFIPPFLSFFPENGEDLMLFLMLFVVALAMGRLTSQLRESEILEHRRERRTAALYELVREAGLAPDLDGGLRAAIRLTGKLFGVRAALLLRRADRTLSPEAHASSSLSLDVQERAAASLAFEQRRPVGKFTDERADSKALHLPLQARNEIMGVLSILPAPGIVFDAAERELLEAFAVLIGAILERDQLLEGLKQAELLRTSERLQRALLQSVSHELKTPLSAVRAGVDALANERDEGERSETALCEIQQALRRLHRVIDNLLDMTRIESKVIHPRLDWCDSTEIVQAALDLASDAIHENPVAIEAGRDLPLVKVDQPLLEQCLCNLLLNAASHSSPGAKIVVRAEVSDSRLKLSVEDEGRGIAESDLPHVFEVFHRGADAPPGGTGLGLAIVEGFVRAHGGSVSARNRHPRGAEFSIVVPVETLRPESLETAS